MRVIVDLVVNHTSDKHPWFRRRRASRGQPVPRLLRVARPTRRRTPPTRSCSRTRRRASGRTTSRTGEWYLHRFYQHQPDLNVDQPGGARRDRQGDGLLAGAGRRRASASTRCRSSSNARASTTGGRRGSPTRTSTCARCARSWVGRQRRRHPARRGEPAATTQQRQFFGGDDGDELTMHVRLHHHAEHLPVAGPRGRRARWSRRWPAGRRSRRTASGPPSCATTTSSPSTSSPTTSAQEVFAAFGPDPDMQLYGRGLRRRLPPMLGGDPRRIRMVYSLLFSLPGTPVLFYGEEIGMGEDLASTGRLAVRTPMQWTAGRNGGFSTAAPSRLCRPVVEGGFGPEHVNVADQRRDPESLLSFMSLLDPPLPRVARSSAGATFERARAAARAGARPRLRAGTTARWSPCTTSARAAHGAAAARRLRRSHRLVDLLQDGSTPSPDDGPGRARARGLRVPLAARGRRGQPTAGLRGLHRYEGPSGRRVRPPAPAPPPARGRAPGPRARR